MIDPPSRMITGLSPERRLVIECVRRSLGQGGSVRTPWRGEQSLEWRQVLDLSLGQGLAPLVHTSLASLGLPVPTSIKEQLRVAYLRAVARTEAWLEPLLRRTLGALGELGIEAIVLKGAALAYTAYGRPFYRTMGDIDLLLPAAEVDRASEALRGAGAGATGAGCKTQHHIPAQYVAGCQLGIELHHDLLPAPSPYTIAVDDLIARSQKVAIAGVGARALAPADALHLVCVHTAYAHRYRWFPLRGLADILAITTANGGGPDWDVLVETARRSRTAGAVYWPLVLSRDWLGAPVPESVLGALAPSSIVRRLTAAITEPQYIIEGRAPTDTGSDVLYNLLLDLSLRGGCSVAEQIRALVHGFFPPPNAVGHLPPSVTGSRLRYAAFLTRPARVARGLVACGRLLARSTTQPVDSGASSVIDKREALW